MEDETLRELLCMDVQKLKEIEEALKRELEFIRGLISLGVLHDGPREMQQISRKAVRR